MDEKGIYGINISFIHNLKITFKKRDIFHVERLTKVYFYRTEAAVFKMKICSHVNRQNDGKEASRRWDSLVSHGGGVGCSKGRKIVWPAAQQQTARPENLPRDHGKIGHSFLTAHDDVLK